MDMNIVNNDKIIEWVKPDGKLIHGDCLEEMKNIPNNSVDMILCDLPYGTTPNSWDKIININKLWNEYWRICGGVIALTASQPFSSLLVVSQINFFKYEFVWNKKIPSGMAYARFQPMRQHENVLIFYKKNNIYNPQMTKRDVPIKGGGMIPTTNTRKGLEVALKKTYGEKNPTTILTFDKVRRGAIHPTQKPISLFEYLIKTYTNPGDTVLDNCSGSGTTAIAAINTMRNWICIEKEKQYFDMSVNRIDKHIEELNNG